MMNNYGVLYEIHHSSFITHHSKRIFLLSGSGLGVWDTGPLFLCAANFQLARPVNAPTQNLAVRFLQLKVGGTFASTEIPSSQPNP